MKKEAYPKKTVEPTKGARRSRVRTQRKQGNSDKEGREELERIAETGKRKRGEGASNKNADDLWELTQGYTHLSGRQLPNKMTDLACEQVPGKCGIETGIAPEMFHFYFLPVHRIGKSSATHG